MGDTFFEPLDEDRFRPTEHTLGPWSPGAQHFGPPASLLARALERVPGGEQRALARVTIEILGPAPLSDLTVRAELVRPGRSVELLSAELSSDKGPVARASAWRMITSDSTEVAVGGADPLPPVEQAEEADWPKRWPTTGGYLAATEWRLAGGSVAEPGKATVWGRQRMPLVHGEEPSAVQRLFLIADSGNGVSNQLDPTVWWFINTELTVHLHRRPSGEWVGLDAATTIGPDGVGTTASRLHDERGQVGTGAQALLVRKR